jgi:hypothetical protein
MLKILILFFTVIFCSTKVWAIDDECKFYKYCGSNSGTSSSKRSSPTVGSASRSNPSIVSKIHGFGLESVFQNNNPLEFNLVTGNGKFGGMLSSSSGENSFFGNRTIELDDTFLKRNGDGKRFKNNKLQLALGVSLINKKYFEFNLGGSGINNKDTKKTNLGFAVSGKLIFFNYGYYYYNDDVKLTLTNHLNYSTLTNYDVIWGKSIHQENYHVKVMTLGTGIGNFAVDAAKIDTQYNFYPSKTSISIISTSYAFSNFLINFAQRIETSDNLAYQNGTLVFMNQKKVFFGGLQYFPNKHISFGVGYNNYLLKEISATMTLFI